MNFLEQNKNDVITKMDSKLSASAIHTYIDEMIHKPFNKLYNFTDSSAHENDNFDFNLEIHPVLDSTNIYLKNLVAQSTPKEGHVVITSEQTEGIGRKGRSFYSPRETGIYFSILLRPNIPTEVATLLTCAAAVSVCRAIESICDLKPGIKWVNDIFINDTKVAGILTQSNYNMKEHVIDSTIVGVGINLFPPQDGFPEDISKTAGWVLSEYTPSLRNKFIAAFLVDFWFHYLELEKKDFIQDYRDLSIIIDRAITVINHEAEQKNYRATVRSIDENCNLIVELEDGSLKTLSYGEISLSMY